ncbi:hypothetical protein HDU97_006542 [Phlyctochytrium planicorne]|nr:hypothetical protein HDU97_006542 [Phlyctochytrium planicorne]
MAILGPLSDLYRIALGGHTAADDIVFEPSNKARNLTIKTSDGLLLGAWHILPTAYYRSVTADVGKKRRGSNVDEGVQLQALRDRPVVLYFHGNAGNRASPKRIETYRNFADKLNVNVLAIDYRGFGNSQGSPTEEGLALDARAAWDWLTERGVLPQNIILLGHSLGTGVATRLARDLSIAHPTEPHLLPRTLILQAPYASIPDVAFEFRTFQVLPILKPVNYLPSLKSHMQKNILDRFDSLAKMPHVGCNVLIIHGKLDREIPCKHGRWLFGVGVAAQRGLGEAVEVALKRVEGVVGGVVGDAKTLLEGLMEEEGGWEMEGRRWISVREEKVLSDTGLKGPPKIMFLELEHAHHNSVQSHDLTYDTIEQFCEITI